MRNSNKEMSELSNLSGTSGRQISNFSHSSSNKLRRGKRSQKKVIMNTEKRIRRESMQASGIKKSNTNSGSSGDKSSGERSIAKSGYKNIDHLEEGFVEDLKSKGFLDL